jgi:hypothetical protein
MPNELNPNDPRNFWQNQEVVSVTITLADVRRKASRFERRIHWRNVREYVAGVVCIVLFTSQLRHLHGWRLPPPLLLIAGGLYVMFQIHRRGSARKVPANVGIMATLEVHRLELERQRGALRSVWLWYLLPMQPGFLATAVVGAIDKGIGFAFRYLVGLVILTVAIWWLNERAARMLDDRIQEVKAMEAGEQ